MDLYMSDEEFGHFAEALATLQPAPLKELQH